MEQRYAPLLREVKRKVAQCDVLPLHTVVCDEQQPEYHCHEQARAHNGCSSLGPRAPCSELPVLTAARDSAALSEPGALWGALAGMDDQHSDGSGQCRQPLKAAGYRVTTVIDGKRDTYMLGIADGAVARISDAGNDTDPGRLPERP